ncbi:MAG TPA: AMP nucleosidase [Methylibium sp.]|uniref:AMP nucleosidase n=1 Tax=Methylibium sp. TaxID=2067992 RepID=UPI002DB855A4|nr:AMP nucleosidase [Methylibium sp.]HEU4460938.1 AMP nucleosidase [Methylibium sp.]
MSSDPISAPRLHHDPHAALAHARAIYDEAVARVRGDLQAFVAGRDPIDRQAACCYPRVTVRTYAATRADTPLAYGFVAGPGRYETTLTRPDLFGDYYLEQFRLLLRNHDVALEVGASRERIPLHFALHEGDHFEGSLDAVRRARLAEVFDLPDLGSMDDGIANGTFTPRLDDHGQRVHPLALFTAARVDYSLHRLRHYTGTSPEHFQNFVLFTNYQFYIDEFVKLGHALMHRTRDDRLPLEVGAEGFDLAEHGEYIAFVEPGNVVMRRAGCTLEPGDFLGAPPPRLPQMPAYHLMRKDRSGITMVNIGVGPSNAKTITDHIAVLRPHAWIMLGHCAGLRTTQRLGDYVLAHGYVREDHVLDEELPLWVPIPALAEIQVALETAVADVTRLEPNELKRVMRTGTVASTDNRNWELLPFQSRGGAGLHGTPEQRFSQSRAIALDMESATVAANGFRFRVPYGTLLCVSDKPLHGEIKLPGMANDFYRERVGQHLRVGLRAIERLREGGVDRLHSRKLRGFAEVAFQ